MVKNQWMIHVSIPFLMRFPMTLNVDGVTKKQKYRKKRTRFDFPLAIPDEFPESLTSRSTKASLTLQKASRIFERLCAPNSARKSSKKQKKKRNGKEARPFWHDIFPHKKEFE
jgi:hypothetical protein